MYDLISIGDSTLDIFLEIEEATVRCKLNKDDCQICLSYPDKVPVKKVTNVYAVGNAANVAIGSARLGLKSAIYTNVGDDTTGHEMIKIFKDEKVDDKYINIDKKNGSNLSIVLNYKGERTILVYHEHRTYQLPADFGPTKWIYFTSIAEGHEVIHEPLVEYVSKNKVSLGFNPGTFQLREGLKTLGSLMRVTKAFFVNKNEAQELIGEAGDIKKLLAELKKHCGGITIITDGAKGSFATDGEKFWKLGIYNLPRVEMTGAGDSYATAFCGALFHGRQVPEAMAWGAVNSASVIGKIGAREALLTKEEIEKHLSQKPEFKGEEF